VAVTNDLGSPIAAAADMVVALRRGDEATVSTKSYLNSLAAHRRLTALIGARPGEGAVGFRSWLVLLWAKAPGSCRLGDLSGV
jgi:glucosamine 6-phosphate synthetase-like amidotransferase/phosphosugar isomerase protein